MESVDVVYIVGGGAKNQDDRPLRWSLRSLAKFATGLGRVIVAGQPPAWLSDAVVKVPCDVSSGGKHWNILNGVENAVRKAGLDGPFLYSSDDHYLAKPFNLAEWPRFYKGMLQSVSSYVAENGKTPDAWKASCCATYEMLKSEGFPFRDVSHHFNTWLDARDLDTVLALARRHARETPFGFEVTSMFNAAFEKRCPGAGYVRVADDRKIYGRLDIDRKLAAGALMFSTSPKSERDKAVVSRMDDLFSGPSPFEKGRYRGLPLF